jgi:Icc protein
MIIAQISDPHISVENEPTALHLQRAVDYLMRLPTTPDVVIITGDCVNGGSVAEYQRFRDLLRPLTMPVYVIPGNHDDRIHLHSVIGDQGTAALPGFIQYVVDTGPVRMIALDTNVPGQGGGNLCAERLDWLEQRLAEAPARPTLIFMHHPPFLTGLAAFDQIGLANADAFAAIIARHPQVERIVAGHVHSIMVRRFHGTLAMTCPATSYHLLPDVQQPDRLVVQMEPPSCLLHIWNEQAGMTTQSSQIGDHGPTKTLYDGQRWIA